MGNGFALVGSGEAEGFQEAGFTDAGGWVGGWCRRRLVREELVTERTRVGGKTDHRAEGGE